MKMEFLPDGPAVVVENTERILVIADIHFGIEADLAAHGIHFRSRTKARLDRMIATIEKADPDRLVLLGDIKHRIPSLSRQEFYELPEILATLRRYVQLEVFPGNHDIGIERFLNDGELWQKEGGIIDDVGYLHGHTIPAPALAGHLLIVGHHHPLVSLHDEVGCALQAPAYIRAEAATGTLWPDREPTGTGTQKVLLVPSFNEVAGYDIARIIKDPFSPISRLLTRENAEIILADGTYLGPAKAVIPDESD